MGEQTAIEWTESTWNPVRGCSRVSRGCGGPGKQGGCYAERIAARFSGPGQPFEGFAQRLGGEARWTGKVALVEDALTLPLRWRKPRRIFVNSMSDLFHEGLPDEAIDRVFAVMTLAPQHTFQILTKRPERMRTYFAFEDRWKRVCAVVPTSFIRWPLPNVWLGTSCEDQATADERIPHLLRTPAAVRFVSLEPLLGPINLAYCGIGIHNCGPLYLWKTDLPGNGGWRKQFSEPAPDLDWVIVGGESGPRARPMDPDWARDLLNQCKAAEVPFFFKQWGEWSPSIAGLNEDHPPLRVGKKAAGCLLDGREHKAFPAALAA